jgi:hypothetical protein
VERAYGALYQRESPPDEPIPMYVSPFNVNDERIPTEAEVATAVQCLKTGKEPGQSRIQAEHLKTLLQAATKDECTPED